ncbi:MAG: DsrE family protein [Cyclobacterium sp.]|uniref:DsrE family protein n=1 Tax=unclassified Cyclobacterium TaxID=2615055 RepID=UPI0013D5767A|nr:DsrE family protein [Cyclobacterium sp. SYSU L10401]
MKISLITFIALLTLSLSLSNAQTAEAIRETEQAIRKDGKYAMLVMKAQHLKAGIKTGIAFKSESEKIDFQIVACGMLVKEISEDAELQSLIKNTVSDHGLKILVCGLSIQQFGVDKTLLPDETPITDNGLIYMFGLQELGYRSITL